MRALLPILIALATGGESLAASPPPPAGASSCTGCHAVSPAAGTAIPRLQGRDAAEIIALMRAFRTGEQPSTVMGRIAKGFTDQEVAAIAEWYARQR